MIFTGRKSLKKRGVSPIIATVLLISFTVALGSVVLNWGRNLDISNSVDSCSEVNMKIRNIGDVNLCYIRSGQNGHINFIIDNMGSVDIEGLGIWIVGEKGTKLLDLDNSPIKIGELLSIEGDKASYDFGNYGNIKHVQFIPKVKNNGVVEICTKSSIKADIIGIC